MDKHDNEKLENDRAPLRLLKQGFLILALVTAGGCASLSDGDDYAVFDTAEGFNRGSYEFTDKIDRAALVPVARGYQWITPDWIETGVANMFTNLTTITSSLNGFLQGKPVSGFTDLGRVLINTTIGVGGFFDPATDLGLKYQQEDFGQTLGVWGVGKGPYVVLPFLGPSNVRDAIGEIPDFLIINEVNNELLHEQDADQRQQAVTQTEQKQRAVEALPASGDLFLLLLHAEEANAEERDHRCREA